MSSALNGNLAIWRFKHSKLNVIEICDEVTFDYYTGLPHILFNYIQNNNNNKKNKQKKKQKKLAFVQRPLSTHASDLLTPIHGYSLKVVFVSLGTFH